MRLSYVHQAYDYNKNEFQCGGSNPESSGRKSSAITARVWVSQLQCRHFTKICLFSQKEHGANLPNYCFNCNSFLDHVYVLICSTSDHQTLKSILMSVMPLGASWQVGGFCSKLLMMLSYWYYKVINTLVYILQKIKY